VAPNDDCPGKEEGARPGITLFCRPSVLERAPLVTKRGGAANLATLVPFFTSFAFSDVIHQYSTSVSSANVSCGSRD
jgi:hypothetical protein